MNETGFSKVVKKWDKRSKSHTKELFISTAVSVQPVFHKNEINELSDLVTQSLFDIESVMDGDYTCLLNFNANSATLHSSSIIRESPAPQSNDQPEDSFSRHSSIVSNQPNNNEIDELYSSFVNVATIKVPDLELLARWVDKVNGSHKIPDQLFTPVVKYKVSKIFYYQLPILKFLIHFLNHFTDS